MLLFDDFKKKEYRMEISENQVCFVSITCRPMNAKFTEESICIKCFQSFRLVGFVRAQTALTKSEVDFLLNREYSVFETMGCLSTISRVRLFFSTFDKLERFELVDQQRGILGMNRDVFNVLELPGGTHETN